MFCVEYVMVCFTHIFLPVLWYTDYAVDTVISCEWSMTALCRYRSVNVAFFRPYQLRELYDGADVNEVVRQSEQKGRKYGNTFYLLPLPSGVACYRHTPRPPVGPVCNPILNQKVIGIS